MPDYRALVLTMELQVLIVLMWVFSCNCEVCPVSSSLKNNLTDVQCSESWCNDSLTCSLGSCPPGLLCKDDLCECPDQYPAMITCDNVGLSVLVENCVTFDETNETVIIGLCIFKYNDNFTLYSTSLAKENNICESYNRTGALCGRCLPDHYPLAYSFNMTCIPCPHARWNWFRYVLAAYLPLTLFYLFILFFKINITNHLFSVIYLCQLILLPVMIQKLYIVISSYDNYFIWIVKMIFSFYGIWNLDFFRPFYSDLCLGIDVLPTLALDYVIAVYPLLLMIITYLLINLHDKNYRIMYFLFRPLRLISHLGKKMDIKTSLIDAFSTFFFLSNGKFLNVSFALLCPVKQYYLHGNSYNHTFGLYYAADIEYFGNEHLPYGILAIAVLFVFVILPTTILALYSFGFFQKFLNLFPVRWYILLHTFMDSFQGYYKDGTEPGTRDCRWFSSLFFIVRVSLFVANTLLHFLGCMIVYVIVLLFHTALLVMFQPYKHAVSHLNTTSILFLLLIILAIISCIGYFVARMVSSSLYKPFFVLGVLLVTIPIWYILAIMSKLTYRIFGLKMLQQLRDWRKKGSPN